MTTSRAPWLADVLRATGLEVVEHKGWQNRGRDFIDLKAVVLHHDASAPGDSPGVPAYMLGEMAAGKAGAQLWVDRRGVWHVLAAGVAFHAGTVLPGMPSNSYSLGVELDHTTGEDWPQAQLDSMRRGSAAILLRLGRDERSLHMHKTICAPVGRKTDPHGLDLTAERARVRRLVPNKLPVRTDTPEDDVAWTAEDKAWLVAMVDDRVRILLRAEDRNGKATGHPNLRDISAKLDNLGADLDALDVPRKA